VSRGINTYCARRRPGSRSTGSRSTDLGRLRVPRRGAPNGRGSARLRGKDPPQCHRRRDPSACDGPVATGRPPADAGVDPCHSGRGRLDGREDHRRSRGSTERAREHRGTLRRRRPGESGGRCSGKSASGGSATTGHASASSAMRCSCTPEPSSSALSSAFIGTSRIALAFQIRVARWSVRSKSTSRSV